MVMKRMGSSEAYITVEEAAVILGVTRFQVYRMVRENQLRRVSELPWRRTMLYAEEVRALADVKESRLSVADLQKTLLAERARRISLERRIERIERRLCIHVPVISYDEAEVVSLVERVREALQDPPTEALEILEWCAVFRSVHEELFQLVQRYTGNQEPWSPFLLLAEELYKNSALFLYQQDAEDAYAELSAARISLRQAAFFYVLQSRGREYAGEVIPEGETDLIRRINSHVL